MKIQTLAGSALPATGKLTRHSPTAVRTAAKLPFSLALVAISIFLPEEFSLFTFGLRFTATRFLFIVLTPFIVVRLFQEISTGRYHFVITDFFVLLSGLWMIFASAQVVGFEAALNHAGPIALEFCLGYFVPRMLLSEHGQALKFISLFCMLVAIAGLLALLDTFGERFWLHSWATALTGYRGVSGEDLGTGGDYRLGFFRAKGPFEHPILLGTISSVGLIIAWHARIVSRKFSIFGCTVGILASVSAAPFQSVLIGFGLLTYNRIVSGGSAKWFALIGLGAVAVGAVWATGHSLQQVVFNHLIFDASSGYYRLWTWNGVIDALNLSPWFGLGFAPFPDYLDINHTIDALCLVLSLNFGVPGAVLVYLSLIAGAALPVSSPRFDLSPVEKELGIALGVVLASIVFISFTVDYWGSSWVVCGVILGVKAHISELGRIGRRPRSPARDISTRRAVQFQ
jgi:hypothetical protein